MAKSHDKDGREQPPSAFLAWRFDIAHHSHEQMVLEEEILQLSYRPDPAGHIRKQPVVY